MTFNHFQYLLPRIGHVSAAMRRSKIIGSNFGLLYRDVAFLPKSIYMGKTINGEFKDSSTICIEIKAKQGFMMEDDDSYFVKKCRFCYFQVFKPNSKQINHVSYFLQIFCLASIWNSRMTESTVCQVTARSTCFLAMLNEWIGRSKGY